MSRLNEIDNDMKLIFTKVLAGELDVKVAAELSNITGKALKAHQLMLARDIFEDNVRQRTPNQ